MEGEGGGGGGWIEPPKPFVEGVWVFLEQHSVKDKTFVFMLCDIGSFCRNILYISYERVKFFIKFGSERVK